MERDGQRYLLVATGRGWIARASLRELMGASALTTPVGGTAGVKFEKSSITGVREVEALSPSSFVVLQLGADSTLTLRTVEASVF
jgi:hypothetical protein